MKREEAIHQIEDTTRRWDVIVIGGGATGLAVALDASSRGFSTLLLEQHDFAKATSSRSTKLIHGGFRYLKQGNIHLVRESLRERGLLLRNAPHIVHPLAFVVPAYHWWEKPYYGAGLKLYDAMSGSLGIGTSTILSRDAALEVAPTLRPDHLLGGVRYFDGQFDDARLAVCMAQSVFDHGGVALNYVRVHELTRSNGRITGLVAVDEESGRELTLKSRVVINATGIFTDHVRRMDDPNVRRMMTVSQGVHVVLDRQFLPGETAIMIPKTDDGRILFAIPWLRRVIVGTTDVAVSQPSLEPKPTAEEIDFLLSQVSRYLVEKPSLGDIRAVFAGLRPLASRAGGSTASIARDHVIEVSSSGLVTITGGKWTTCRKMAEDTLDRAIEIGGLDKRPSVTESLPLHGATPVEGERVQNVSVFSAYGSDSHHLKALMNESSALATRLHPRLPYLAAEVVWAVRREMARSVEDVLARRMRALALDAKAAAEAAPEVARILADELGHNEAWQSAEVAAFRAMAEQCLPAGLVGQTGGNSSSSVTQT